MNGWKHNELQNTAIRWLYERRCSVFAKEVPTWNGVADAIGVKRANNIKDDRVYYIEAKASRSDLLCPKQKACYARTEKESDTCDKCFEKIVPGNIKYGFFTCSKCGWLVKHYQNNIDYFYFIVADGITVEDSLYPLWGVINEKGEVVRKAKRIKKIVDSTEIIAAIAHVLVYKVFGKMYLGEPMPNQDLIPTI